MEIIDTPQLYVCLKIPSTLIANLQPTPEGPQATWHVVPHFPWGQPQPLRAQPRRVPFSRNAH
jgi:hypothetical protein